MDTRLSSSPTHLINREADYETILEHAVAELIYKFDEKFTINICLSAPDAISLLHYLKKK